MGPLGSSEKKAEWPLLESCFEAVTALAADLAVKEIDRVPERRTSGLRVEELRSKDAIGEDGQCFGVEARL